MYIESEWFVGNMCIINLQLICSPVFFQISFLISSNEIKEVLATSARVFLHFYYFPKYSFK